MSVEFIKQKLLKNRTNTSNPICCFEDEDNTCLKIERDSTIFCNQSNSLQKLLESGMLQVNKQYESGNTILHLAAKNADHKAIKLFLDNGANVNIRNDANETPLHLIFPSKASNERKRECVEILIQHGADYDVVNVEGDSLIKVALKNGSFFSLQPIIAHIAWLQQLDLPIDERIFEQIQFVCILKKYYRKCIQNLDEMKNRKIQGENITEYEIIIESEDRIAECYMHNPVVIRKLLEHKVHSDYYFYNCLFKTKILKAVEIQRLRMDANSLFRRSIKLFQYSSHIIVDKIVSHLSYDDLYSLKHIVEEEENKKDEKEAESNI